MTETVVVVLGGQLRDQRRHAAAMKVNDARVQLRTEAEWMRRMPKARQTKAKHRQVLGSLQLSARPK